MTRPLPALAALLLAALASGCASQQEASRICPQLIAVDDARELTRFAGEGRESADIQFQAEIADVNGTCDYDEEALDVVMTVDIVATRGAANRDGRAPLAYFVAIADPENRVLARREFDTVIEFPAGQDRAGVSEELEQHIPLPQQVAGRYSVYVGFALSEDELAYNRQSVR